MVENETFTINEALRLLADGILRSSCICEEQLIQRLAKDTGKNSEIAVRDLWQVVFEFEFLFLHISDRMAFEVLGSRKRATFMDSLSDITAESSAEAVFEDGADKQEKAKKILKDSFFIDLNERNNYYGNCKKLAPEESEHAKDTVLWEFGKKLSKVVGEPIENLPVIMGAIALAGESLILLNIKDILQRIR